MPQAQYASVLPLPAAALLDHEEGLPPQRRADMKELRNGCPSMVPRTLTSPRVPKNSADPSICT